jgi:hypothetical protein
VAMNVCTKLASCGDGAGLWLVLTVAHELESKARPGTAAVPRLAKITSCSPVVQVGPCFCKAKPPIRLTLDKRVGFITGLVATNHLGGHSC